VHITFPIQQRRDVQQMTRDILQPVNERQRHVLIPVNVRVQNAKSIAPALLKLPKADSVF